MKFTCDNCSTQYLISDDKVTGRGVKVRCKRCGNVIILRSDGTEEKEPAAPTSLPKAPAHQSEDEVGEAFDSLLKGGDDGDDEDEGPATMLFDASDLQRSQRDEASPSSDKKPEDRLDEVFRAAESTSTRPSHADDPEQKDWYVAIGDRQAGPMALAEVLALFRAGEINVRSLAWHPGMSSWAAIAEIPALVAQVGQTAVDQEPTKIERATEAEANEWGPYRGSALTDLVDKEIAQAKTSSPQGSESGAGSRAPGRENLWDGESSAEPGRPGSLASPLKDDADLPPWEQSSADPAPKVGQSFFDSSLDPVATGESKYFSSSGSRSRLLAGPAYLREGKKRGSKFLWLVLGVGGIAAAAYFMKPELFSDQESVAAAVAPPVANREPPSVEQPKPAKPAVTVVTPAPVEEPPETNASEAKEGSPGRALSPGRTAKRERPEDRSPPKERPKSASVAQKEEPEKKKEKRPERTESAADSGGSDVPRQVSREQIQETMQKHIKAMKLCVEQQLQRDPNITGTMRVQFTIAPAGNVSEVNVKTAEHRDSFVAGCITFIIKSMKFPKAREPFTVSELPLRLGG